MKINDNVAINNYNIVLKEVNQIKIKNYLAVRGNFSVYDDAKNDILYNLTPEIRFYPITGVSTSEASIHTNFLRDLYIVLGEGDSRSGWSIRIYYNPLVAWIWIGAFIIFLGGLFSIKNNLATIKRLF